MSIRSISPQEFQQIFQQDPSVELIDVRTPVEFREVHASMAKSLPLDRLDAKEFVAQRGASKGRPMYFICKSGSRSAKACEKLVGAGIENVASIEGGTDAWAGAGLPVVRGKKMMSLERQVRIAAGSLVVIGVILGWLIHPGFYGISAFVGAGLVVAGLTDTCGMGMLIAKMPWNQVRQTPQGQLHTT